MRHTAFGAIREISIPGVKGGSGIDKSNGLRIIYTYIYDNHQKVLLLEFSPKYLISITDSRFVSLT